MVKRANVLLSQLTAMPVVNAYSGIFSRIRINSFLQAKVYTDKSESILDLHISKTDKLLCSPSPCMQIIKSPLFVNIIFLHPLQNISVQVIKDTKTVAYEAGINDTQDSNQLLINISNWEKGTYNIRFSNASGRNIFSVFEV